MFRKQERQRIIAYLYYSRDVQGLNRHGDVLYHSRKMRYQILYVSKEEAEDIAKEISELEFVKEVSLPQFDNADENLVGNLARF